MKIPKLLKKPKVIIGGGLALLSFFTAQKIQHLAAEPLGERDCDFVYPYTSDKNTLQIELKNLDEPSFEMLQKGGDINDASCLNKTKVYGIAKITTEADIKLALEFARENNLKITPAGKQHTMGGHTFTPGGLVLDMKGYNQVNFDKAAMTMKVESGATWKQVQAKLDPAGLAVEAMQSINLFTVGGTLSVNAHGIAHNPGQVGPTIRSLRVMLPSGKIETASPTENKELFGAVVGGYGLNGIILDVEFDIVDNEVYEWDKRYIDYQDFPSYYSKNIIDNDEVALFYGRLSIAPGKNYLKETAIHSYKYTDVESEPEALKGASKVAIKRFIFNLSKTGDFGRWVRWMTEKHLEPGVHTCVSRNQVMAGEDEKACLASRNQKMNQSMEYLEGRIKDTNILHEYFIPLEKTTEFIDGLRDVVKETDVNLLNVTIRIVTKDTISALPYAKADRIAFVLYFNQKLTETDSQKLQSATERLVDLSIETGGTYYLPYQLYYSPEQLRAAYPEVDDFFALKKKYDPDVLLSNSFYQKYGPTDQQ